MKIEVKVDGLEFKGTVDNTNTEAQAMFSNLLGGVFGYQAPVQAKIPVSNVAPPNQTAVPKEVAPAPVVKDTAESDETYTLKDVVEVAEKMAEEMVKKAPKAKSSTDNIHKYPKEQDILGELVDHTTRPEPTGKKKLLVGKCECGESHFLWVYDNGQPCVFKCRKCDKEHRAEYYKLTKAFISCNNCGYKGYAFVNGTQPLEHKCKQCESPIDLVYHEAHRCMESL